MLTDNVALIATFHSYTCLLYNTTDPLRIRTVGPVQPFQKLNVVQTVTFLYIFLYQIVFTTVVDSVFEVIDIPWQNGMHKDLGICDKTIYNFALKIKHQHNVFGVFFPYFPV